MKLGEQNQIRMISFFVALASHLREKHLLQETSNLQEIKQSTHSRSISEGERRPDVTTVTERITGPTTVRGEERCRQQQNPKSTETVKYDYFTLHEHDYEYEHNAIKNGESFYVGSLRSNYNFWKNTLNANHFVLNVISSGYLIPFFNKPTSAYLKNNQSAFAHASFVEQAINKLLDIGAVVETKDQIHCKPANRVR